MDNPFMTAQANADLDPNVPLPVDETQIWDDKGHITRQGIIATIKGGGTVHWKGKYIFTLAQVPDEVEFAGKDPVKIQVAKHNLDAQIANLQAARAQLEGVGAQVEQEEADKADTTPAEKPVLTAAVVGGDGNPANPPTATGVTPTGTNAAELSQVDPNEVLLEGFKPLTDAQVKKLSAAERIQYEADLTHYQASQTPQE